MKELANHFIVEFINNHELDKKCDNSNIFWYEIISNPDYRIKIVDSIIIESKDFHKNIERLWLQENPTSNYADYYFNRKNYIELFKRILDRNLIKVAKVYF